jgi:hypothetical protein
MIVFICFGIALSRSGYEPRIFPPQQGMERAACPFHIRMHVCLHRVCRRSLAVCLQPHLIGERLMSVAVYGSVSQNMLYRLDGRVQFLIPILDHLAQTCFGANTAPYPVGTECVYAWVKGPDHEADYTPHTSQYYLTVCYIDKGTNRMCRMPHCLWQSITNCCTSIEAHP